MKIKRSAVVSTVVSVLILVFASAYFSVGLPVLNALINPLPQGGHTNSSGVVISGDILHLDFGDESNKETLAPNATMPPAVEITPGGQVGEIQQVEGRQVIFKPGTKNVLLLGYNSDEGLCDSIFILNIDEETKVMKLVSIPRDAYVPYSAEIQSIMKQKNYYNSPGSFKINAATYMGNNIVKYEGGKFGNSGIDFLCSIIDNLLPNGCKIDEYVYVDFDGFMDIIDTVGGVEVTVQENMYSRSGELMLAKGKQRLNARQALFYVRYRTRINADGTVDGGGGDNFRKVNQVGFLVEISSQIITKENMKLSKVTSMMETLKQSVFHSFGDLTKLQEYIDIGVDFANGKYTIAPYVVVGPEIDPMGDKICYVKIY